MTTKIKKWGNSLAVRLPKNIVEKMGLKENTSVEIAENNNVVNIKPTNIDKLSLKTVVGLINKENIHKEVVFGAKTGKEIW